MHTDVESHAIIDRCMRVENYKGSHTEWKC